MPSPIAKITQALIAAEKIKSGRRKREREISTAEGKLTDRRLKFLTQQLKDTKAQLKEITGRQTKAAKADVDFRPKEPAPELAGRIAEKKRLTTARKGSKVSVRILREREEEYIRLGGDEGEAKRLKSSELKARIVSMTAQRKGQVKAAEADVEFRPGEDEVSLARRVGAKKRLIAARGKARSQIQKLREREEEFIRRGGDPRVAKTMTSSQLKAGINRFKKVASDADKLAKQKAAHVKEVDGLVTTDKKTGEQFVDITEARRKHLRKRQEELFPGEPVPPSLWTDEEDRRFAAKVDKEFPEPSFFRDPRRAIGGALGFSLAEEEAREEGISRLGSSFVIAPTIGKQGEPTSSTQTPGQQAQGTRRLLGRKGTSRQVGEKTAKGSKPLAPRTKRAGQTTRQSVGPLKPASQMTNEELFDALGLEIEGLR